MVVQIPYTDFKSLESDSAKLNDVKAILGATFPDDTCQLIAVKSVLGIVDAVADDSTTGDDSSSSGGSTPSGDGTTPTDPSVP